MAQIDIEDIERVTRRAVQAYGAEDTIAATIADAARWAEERGNRICGPYYMESYCQQLLTGRVRGNATPATWQPRPGVVEVDAGKGFCTACLPRSVQIGSKGCAHQRNCKLADPARP